MAAVLYTLHTCGDEMPRAVGAALDRVCCGGSYADSGMASSMNMLEGGLDPTASLGPWNCRMDVSTLWECTGLGTSSALRAVSRLLDWGCTGVISNVGLGLRHVLEGGTAQMASL